MPRIPKPEPRPPRPADRTAAPNGATLTAALEWFAVAVVIVAVYVFVPVVA